MTPASARFTPGSTFAGRFTIIEEIGAGGMGIVFKAIDRVLRQHVALKIIQPELAGRREFVQRFRREVTVARQISHPNVCRVHDLGQVGDIHYLSMEWIEGETLRRLIRQAERLGEHRALEIAEQIARGLAAAHAKGIIHRDLKPENVMIDRRGTVHVMDFGLAKEVGPGHSRTSSVVGTPGYMAPEQMREGEKIDERTDLYSLGLILQEMLTGKPPSRDLSHSGFRSQVSHRLAPVVQNLVEEEIDARPRSAEIVGDALAHIRGPGRLVRLGARAGTWIADHRGWVGGVALALLILPVAWWLIPFAPPASEAQVFYERGLLYLRESGATDAELSNAVNMFHRCLRADESFVPCRARLGEAYWRRFELDKNPELRRLATEAVDAALKQDPDLPEARNARARGLIAMGRNEEARDELTRLVRDAPQSDEAWVNLARAFRELGQYAKGRDALDAAVRVNPASYQHQISRGKFFMSFNEYEEAESAFRRAIVLKPDSLLAWSNLGGTYLLMGRPKEAVKALSQALSLKEYADGRSNLGTAYYNLNRFEEAAENYRRATELDPGDAVHWGNLGDALRMLDDEEGARAAYERAVEIARADARVTPLSPASRINLGLWCARAGDLDCAEKEAGEALAMQPENTYALFINAVVQTDLGHTDVALDHLEQGVALGLGRASIETEPDFAPLHEHPRYRKLLALAK